MGNTWTQPWAKYVGTGQKQGNTLKTLWEKQNAMGHHLYCRKSHAKVLDAVYIHIRYWNIHQNTVTLCNIATNDASHGNKIPHMKAQMTFLKFGPQNS